LDQPHDPGRCGLDFGRWRRKVTADLIERKFGARLGLTTIRELLAKLNLTPQKLLQWPYQHDPEALEKWRRETKPAIAPQAEGGEVYFRDESGFRVTPCMDARGGAS
jgi:Winged helix-turn helix